MTKSSLTAEGHVHIPVGSGRIILVCCPLHSTGELRVWVKATGKGISIDDWTCQMDGCTWRGAQGLRFYLLGDDSVEVEHL